MVDSEASACAGLTTPRDLDLDMRPNRPLLESKQISERAPDTSLDTSSNPVTLLYPSPLCSRIPSRALSSPEHPEASYFHSPRKAFAHSSIHPRAVLRDS